MLSSLYVVALRGLMRRWRGSPRQKTLQFGWGPGWMNG